MFIDIIAPIFRKKSIMLHQIVLELQYIWSSLIPQDLLDNAKGEGEVKILIFFEPVTKYC